MSYCGNILITGNSSGIGYSLTEEYLKQGWTVYGLSRRGCSGLNGDLYDIRCDLTDLDAIESALERLLTDVDALDLVVLNAGVLGLIQELNKTSLEQIKQIMDVNLWANKAIMDYLYRSDIQIRQIVMMSSGAAVNGSKGWGGYSLSKAALNMLAKLYVSEFPDTHIAAFAPGVVHTQMLDYIRDDVDIEEFPSAQRLREAIGTDQMPEPDQAAELLVEAFARLPQYPSGSFLDIRTMDLV